MYAVFCTIQYICSGVSLLLGSSDVIGNYRREGAGGAPEGERKIFLTGFFWRTWSKILTVEVDTTFLLCVLF